MLIYAFLSVIIYADHHLYAQEFQKGAKEFLSTKQTLRFEQNVGQYHAIDQQHKNREVKFVLKNGLHKIFLLSNGLAHQFDQLIYPKGYDPSASEPKKIEAQEKLAKQVKLNSYRMDMELLGANPHPVITSKGKSAYPERYMNGEMHEAYTWQEITYHDVYPGIDWVLYSKGNELKYDFVVHAGADPSKIKLKLVEAGQSSLEADGSFQWSNPLGWVKENKPLSLQDGREINSCYQYANGILAFKLGDYDRSKDLLIDPSLQWGTYHGGGAADEVYGVATDGNGNVFIVGSTYSNNGISSPGAHQSSYGGSLDAFVVKFDSNGLRQWCTYYGGNKLDNGYAIATDDSGNVYISGQTYSTSGIASSSAHQSSLSGTNDAFVVKFNSSGVRQWGTYYGGSSSDYAKGIATDGSGNVLVIGSTRSTNRISTSGVHQSSNGGTNDAFVVKFNSNGVRQWGTYYGGSSFDEGYGIATDSFGNVFIVGEAMSTNGISSPGAYQSSNGGSLDAYVAKLNSNGVRQWGTYFGGSGADDGRAIATDVSGNVFITGATYSANRISTPGAHQSSYGGSKDAYIAKFHSNGMRLWSTYYGGSSSDETFGIATDVSGNVLVTGNTYSTNAISTLGVHQTNNGGSVDAFVAKFNNNGVRQWASYYGGSSSDYAEGVAADGSGNVLIAGSTFSTNGIATSGAYQTSGAGSRDAFVAKFKANFPQFRLHPQSAGVNCAYDSMFFNCSVNEPTDSLQWQKYNGSAWVRLKGGQDTFYIPSQNDRNKNGDSIRVLLYVKTLGIASNSAIVQIKGDRPMIAINTTTQPTAGDSDGSIDLDVNGYGSYLRYARWSNSTGHNHPNGADFDLSNAPEGSHYLMLITKEKCVYYEGPYYLGIPK